MSKQINPFNSTIDPIEVIQDKTKDLELQEYLDIMGTKFYKESENKNTPLNEKE